MGALMGGAIIFGGLAWERFAPETWRPSYIVGNFAGATITAEKNASMVAAATELQLLSQEKARLEIEVKDYEARMAMTAKSFETELELQRLGYDAQVQRVTEAYRALHERGNVINQTVAGMVQSLVQQRTTLAQSHQGGKVLGSMVGDLMSLFGEATGNGELAANGRRISENATAGSLNAVDAAIARELPNFQIGAWAAGLPNPSQLMVEVEQMKKPIPSSTPAPPQRGVQPPAPYATVVKKE